MRLITVKSLFNEVSRDFDRNEMCERFSRRILVDCGTGVVLADDFCLETVTFRRNPRDDVIVLFLVTENGRLSRNEMALSLRDFNLKLLSDYSME